MSSTGGVDWQTLTMGIIVPALVAVIYYFQRQSQRRKERIDSDEEKFEALKEKILKDKEENRNTELGDIKESLGEVKTAMEGVRTDISNMASREYVENAIKATNLETLHKYEKLEISINKDFARALNTLNTAIAETRTMKTFMRTLQDETNRIFFSLADEEGKKTIEAFLKMISLKTEDFMKGREDLI